MIHEAEFSKMRLFTRGRRRDTILITAVLCGACCVVSTYAQCTDDSQCHEGFYCQPDLKTCQECLSCELLKRAPPTQPTACINSISLCGPCIDGLVEDHLGDLTSECVADRKQMAPGEGTSPYIWVAVALGLLLLVVVLASIIYVLRNTDTFKILASTRTSVQSQCAHAVASAPEPPPPYNSYYSEHAPLSPMYAPVPSSSPVPPFTDGRLDEDVEAGSVMMKNGVNGGSRARESAGHERARVFNNPAYVRPPPAQPDLDDEEVSSQAHPAGHDELTMESLWTPDNSALSDTNGNVPESGAAASPLSAQLVAARHTTLVTPPPPKMLCLRQDTNNNRRHDESSASGSHMPPHPPAPSVVINVVQSMNTIQQSNEF